MLSQRGQGAGRPAELTDEDPWTNLVKPFAMAFNTGKPDRDLEAEGDRERMLSVAAPGDWRVTISLRLIR